MDEQMNEQIEEMAARVSDSLYEWSNEPNKEDFCPVYVAKALYKAGYRKQSEGEWKNGITGYTCSICGEQETTNRYTFCPNCGAKMKGDAE